MGQNVIAYVCVAIVWVGNLKRSVVAWETMMFKHDLNAWSFNFFRSSLTENETQQAVGKC